jgi:hypothetical protein
MPLDARHYCDFPSCDKSFQRLEHLKRHKLNRRLLIRLSAPRELLTTLWQTPIGQSPAPNVITSSTGMTSFSAI